MNWSITAVLASVVALFMAAVRWLIRQEHADPQPILNAHPNEETVVPARYPPFPASVSSVIHLDDDLIIQFRVPTDVTVDETGLLDVVIHGPDAERVAGLVGRWRESDAQFVLRLDQYVTAIEPDGTETILAFLL